MGVAAFVKFCKIGALSATGTRPFDAGADGFVMGEGAALFVLKRLADAERDGDRIYAVLLGIGGASDGKGKGITAPNPAGQRLAIARAWHNAGVDPATVSCIEAHGTSTRVGDAAELESLDVRASAAGELPPGSIALGSVKSNIGHLKAAAGPAGLFKLVMALHEKVLPPSLNFRDPNPNVDWAATPFAVNTRAARVAAAAAAACGVAASARSASAAPTSTPSSRSTSLAGTAMLTGTCSPGQTSRPAAAPAPTSSPPTAAANRPTRPTARPPNVRPSRRRCAARSW